MEKTDLIKNKLNTENQFVVPPMLIRTLDADGFLRANGSFLTMVGFSEAELIEEPFLYWIDPNDATVAIATIEGKQSSCRITHRTKDGKHLPLQIRVVENDGESLVLAHPLEDAKLINGPKDSEDEATVRGTLHTIACIVEEQNPGYQCSILLVADGRFVRGAGPSLPEDYNSAIDGHTIGPTVGSCGTAIYWNVPVIVEDIQADPLWAPFAELAKKAGVAACWSYPFTSTTGDVLGALALYSPVPKIPTKEQLGRLKAAARITGLAVERGRSEEALHVKIKRELELEKQLLQAHKLESIGNLAGGIAHDFNNILSSIIGFTELAFEAAPAGSSQRDDLEEVFIAGNRAKELVQQILAFARQSEEETKPIKLSDIVTETVKLIRPSTPTTIDIKPNINSTANVMGNPSRLHQVVMNLCTNAIHSLQKSGEVLEISLRDIFLANDSESKTSELPSGEYVELTITDNGAGIDPAITEKIFEPYFTTKGVGDGTGMGLAMVKGIIESYRGDIKVNSEPGNKTSFVIRLPVVTGRTSEAISQADSPASGTERILFVDDEPPIARMGSRMLESLGYKVTMRTSSFEALELFRAKPDAFDLAITDMTMPSMTGDVLSIELRKIRHDIPIILCTGYSNKINYGGAKQIGIDAFVYKPFTKPDLAKIIREVLDAC